MALACCTVQYSVLFLVPLQHTHTHTRDHTSFAEIGFPPRNEIRFFFVVVGALLLNSYVTSQHNVIILLWVLKQRKKLCRILDLARASLRVRTFRCTVWLPSAFQASHRKNVANVGSDVDHNFRWVDIFHFSLPLPTLAWGRNSCHTHILQSLSPLLRSMFIIS